MRQSLVLGSTALGVALIAAACGSPHAPAPGAPSASLATDASFVGPSDGASVLAPPIMDAAVADDAMMDAAPDAPLVDAGSGDADAGPSLAASLTRCCKDLARLAASLGASPAGAVTGQIAQKCTATARTFAATGTAAEIRQLRDFLHAFSATPSSCRSF